MANINTEQLYNSIVTTLPNLTQIQTEKVRRFFTGEGTELLQDVPLYKSVLETSVGYFLQLIREWKFKSPLESLGVIKRGSNVGFNIQRMYVYESDNEFNDPSFLDGPNSSNGAPLVPLKKNFNVKQRFAPVNLAAQIWTTIWDDMYFSNIANDEGDRMMIISMIVQDVYKKWERYIYSLEAAMISEQGDLTKLKDTQQIGVDLGGDSYLDVTGDGAINFVSEFENVDAYGRTVGTAAFNEESFQEYFDNENMTLICRLGFKNRIRASLMRSNFYSPQYVQNMIDKIKEVPCPLSPCIWTLKADDPETSGKAGQELHIVYSDDGNGVPLGLSINDGTASGTASVQYQFSSDKVEYAETNPNIFGMYISSDRINIISGPGGELSAEMTVE